MQDERRQGEVVHHLRFVSAVAEVRNIVGVRDVGLGDQHHTRRNFVQHGAQKLNDPVRLRQVNAGRADFLPQIGYRIQPDKFRAPRNVKQQEIDDLQQHLGLPTVEIDLIFAERRPHLLFAGRGSEARQQRQGAGADDARQIGVAFDDDEVIAVFRIVAQERLKPRAPGRGVIDHRVEHQAKVAPNLGYVFPTAKRGVNGAIINHRKTVVGGIWVKRQNVNAADQPGEMLRTEIGQRLQRRRVWLAELIAVSDEDGIFFGNG